MDDLEITRRCVEAMELPEIQPYPLTGGIGYRCRPGESQWLRKYDPLTDDAQAMALVKRFELNISFYEEGKEKRWYVGAPDKKRWRSNPDLNRAICLAVAQRGKE